MCFNKPGIDLFSLYILFSHFRPRDATWGNSFFQMSSYARANLRITNEETKGKFPWGHHVVWNGKTKCTSWKGLLNWNQRFRDKKIKWNSCHHMLTSFSQLQKRSYHVVERTAKFPKMKNVRAKREKLLFFIVKYANVWRSCCSRLCGCLSSLYFHQEVHKQKPGICYTYMYTSVSYTISYF